jgi:acetyltransferase-like isoleucine patch superfamily enzyme
MTLTSAIKSNPRLKKLASWMLIPKNQYRPRLWVKLFLNPFKHHRGKGSSISSRAKLDVFPYNNFELGNNSLIESFSTINNGVGDVVIGNHSLIGTGNVVIGPVVIGNDVILAPNVVISGLNHGYEDIHIAPVNQPTVTAQIVIHDNVWIGANSVITAGVTVGKHAILGAGSIVTTDIPEYVVAVGNPARIIKKYNHDTKAWEKCK